MGEGGCAFAFVVGWQGFYSFADYTLGVLGILIQGGYDLRAGDGFVIGMPAIVVGDHGNSGIANFSFSRELCFGYVGHANDFEAQLPMDVGFR